VKYSKLNLGQIEALVNTIGGMNSVDKLLSGEFKVVLSPNPTVTLEQLERMFVGKRLRIVDSEPDEFCGCDRGVAKEVFGSGRRFSVTMEMDEAFMGQKKCTIGFEVQTITPTFTEGPLNAAKGGRRKIEVIG
jgi:hypothetical protein